MTAMASAGPRYVYAAVRVLARSDEAGVEEVVTELLQPGQGGRHRGGRPRVQGSPQGATARWSVLVTIRSTSWVPRWVRRWLTRVSAARVGRRRGRRG
jgi:hypothetical protein